MIRNCHFLPIQPGRSHCAYIIYLSIIVISILASCTSPTPSPTPSEIQTPIITTDNFPRLDSSTSSEPIMSMIVCQFLDVECEWVEWLNGDKRLMPVLSVSEPQIPQFIANGTHGSYLNLITGQTDLILVARQPSDDELALVSLSNVKLDVQPIALDAFVFIVNKQNPLDELSTSQIRDIYTGKLTNWRQVGGIDDEIHPYQRNENSGSQELMRDLIMRNLKMADVPELILPSMFAPFYAVSTDELGIGYSVFYYEENMAPEKEWIKLIAVDGVQPNKDTISKSDYPYTTEVFVAVRKNLPPGSLTYQLRDWLKSPAGQTLIQESGYVPYY